jgi:hypothetical protein
MMATERSHYPLAIYVLTVGQRSILQPQQNLAETPGEGVRLLPRSPIRAIPQTAGRLAPRGADNPFGATAATQNAAEKSPLAAECSHPMRAARVTALARSGHRDSVTAVGVIRQREGGSRYP